jgi:ADP-heptose:LPS heptosyltransferase
VTAPTVLALRALGLGDLLVGVPALRALHRAFPEHRIVLAAPGELAALATWTGAVDEVLPTTGPCLPRPLARPDVAVNLHGAGPASHRALDAVRPHRRIGPARDDPGRPRWAGPGPELMADPAVHERERWCAVLRHHGVAADASDLRLALPPAAGRRGVTVVHPGAAFGAKRWPAPRFAAVVRAVGRDGPVVVTGGAAEVDLAREVAGDTATVYAGATSPLELATLVAGAELVVCGDTGVAHLASAFGTPSVVLFGPVPPSRWGPPPGPHRVLTDAGSRRGEPFAATPDPALLAVGVDDVLRAAAQVRGARPAR